MDSTQSRRVRRVAQSPSKGKGANRRNRSPFQWLVSHPVLLWYRVAATIAALIAVALPFVLDRLGGEVGRTVPDDPVVRAIPGDSRPVLLWLDGPNALVGRLDDAGTLWVDGQLVLKSGHYTGGARSIRGWEVSRIVWPDGRVEIPNWAR